MWKLLLLCAAVALIVRIAAGLMGLSLLLGAIIAGATAVVLAFALGRDWFVK